ncbi:lipase family protein [Phyllobacterium phragmitis]|uniref:Alpha/beta fold hydrolase n=1 Tax=Phyllobacterium phragmitis TaxID=2670329 RepID=A0ABQ0GWL6_9HYPH
MRSSAIGIFACTVSALFATEAATGEAETGARAAAEIAATGQLPTGPAAGDMELSPFYRWTAGMPDKPGHLLRKEPVSGQQEPASASQTLRILYTSMDARWRSGPIPVSGTLYLPAGTPPAGGWPVIAWGHGTLGIADVCAPSWTGFKPRDAAYINRWLDAGFAVVATDYQGLGGPGPHPYLYWQAEGRSILDSVRAVSAAAPGLLSSHVVIAGQSQGAGAALGAALLLREYAPELRILGIVATAPNSTFPDGPVSLPVRNSPNMFLSVVTVGLRDEGVKVEDILSEKGKRLLETARRGCTREIGMEARKLEVGSLADAFSIPLDELAAIRINATDMPMKTVGVPLLIATGLADATVEPERQYAVVSALCAADNEVIWRRYEGLGHGETLHGSFEDSVAFARTLLQGEKVAGNCSEASAPGPLQQRDPHAPFNGD